MASMGSWSTKVLSYIGPVEYVPLHLSGSRTERSLEAGIRGDRPFSWKRDRRVCAAAMISAGLLVAALVAGVACRAARGSLSAGPEGGVAVLLASVGKGQGTCHTAVGAEPCRRDVLFAQSSVADHPDWYPGLSKDSSEKAFQALLHKQHNEDGEPRCPRPCDFEAPNPTAKVQPTGERCHTARPGEDCAEHVKYTARDLKDHPDHYHGLDSRSTFKEIQAFLHLQVQKDGSRACPQPCGSVDFDPRDVDAKSGKCRTAVKGERCFDAVHWVHSVGCKKHPKWFKGIDESSTPEEIQNILSKNKGSHCSVPACPCHDAQVGEDCYTHTAFTKALIPKHPNWYPGLTVHSSFKEVQHYMAHETTHEGKRVCPQPCGMREADKVEDNETKDCHTAIVGEPCYDQVLWAMDAVDTHPEWYQGLTSKSTPEEFQALLHEGKKDSQGKRCPKPCSSKALESVAMQATGACHTSSKGDPCYSSVVKVYKVGLARYPERFSAINKSSTFEEVQTFLLKVTGSHCENRPCPCHTTVRGEKCFESVQWVRTVGIRRHPRRFEGITASSSVEKVQLRLHGDHQYHCLLPCAEPWSALSA